MNIAESTLNRVIYAYSESLTEYLDVDNWQVLDATDNLITIKHIHACIRQLVSGVNWDLS